MAEAKTVTSFRLHNDTVPDWEEIMLWCENNKSNVNCVINSFLPAIAYAITRQAFVDPETGKRYIRADFGDILLREPHQRS